MRSDLNQAAKVAQVDFFSPDCTDGLHPGDYVFLLFKFNIAPGISYWDTYKGIYWGDGKFYLHPVGADLIPDSALERMKIKVKEEDVIDKQDMIGWAPLLPITLRDMSEEGFNG